MPDQHPILAFIAGRIAEEEADALAAGGLAEHWTHDGTVYRDHPTNEVMSWAYGDVEAHIARQDPAATLARVAALRALVADLAAVTGPESPCDLVDSAASQALRHVAAIWPSHPDFDESWRP